MMIQNAPPGEPRFICSMAAHNDLTEQFVRAFGNETFERPEPFEEMVYVVSHHDRGWADFDENPILDPASGLPRGLGTAPIPEGQETSRLSPDFNENRHPYCGLLSSMHSWGLHHARYGFSNFSTRPGGPKSVPIAGPNADKIQAMLDSEIARQERLKGALAENPETRGWIEDQHLNQNYKQLQFFDTLALYFNLRHESERTEEVYIHVPMNAGQDTEVTVKPLGDGKYSVSPFPFAGDRLEATCRGRYVEPWPEGDAPDDLGAAMRAIPETEQVYTLVAG